MDDIFGLCEIFEVGVVCVVVVWSFDVVECVVFWMWLWEVVVFGIVDYCCLDLCLYLMIVEVVGVLLFVMLMVENWSWVNELFDSFLLLFCNIEYLNC